MIESAPDCTVLNLNVPGRTRDDVLGLRWAKLDRFGSVRAAVAESGANGLQIEFRDTGATLDPESDTALVAGGYATLTTIIGVDEVLVEPREPGPKPRVERSIEPVPHPSEIDVPMQPLHLTGARGR
jgi:hypothetical protein